MVQEDEQEDSSDEQDEDKDEDGQGLDYDYLLGMKMWCLTKERKDEILKQRDQKIQELELLKDKTPEDLWNDDLDTFMNEVRNVFWRGMRSDINFCWWLLEES